MANNTCIICGQPAGSREHVFPASFGGRREDKGIYCGTHNNEFGRHVNALLDQLDIVNAALGVRPDRWDTVRPAPATASNGDTYLVAKNSLRVAPPANLDAGAPLDGAVELKFADQADADRWIAEQRRRGYEIKVVGPTTVRTSYFTAPLQMQKELGGPAFRRAMLYLGLTFLAHHYPDRARSTGLAAVKEEIQRPDDAPLVVEASWQLPASLLQLPANPYPHGHSVTIAVDAAGEATALISLWGAIQFGMGLGTVEPVGPERVVTFINPLADRPPDDRQVVREQGAGLTLGTAEEGRAYVAQVASGAVPNPLQAVLNAASEAELGERAAVLLGKLKEANSRPMPFRQQALVDALITERQRLFNLLRGGIEDFLKFDPVLKPLAPGLMQFIQPDENGPNGLSQAAEAALHLVLVFLAEDMRRRLDAGTLDAEAVARLIGGGEGMALAFKSVVVPMIMSIATGKPLQFEEIGQAKETGEINS